MSATNVGVRAPKLRSSALLAYVLVIEAIVLITQALPLLNEQAGVIQGRCSRFHGKFIPVQNNSNASVIQTASGLQPFHSKDVSILPGCIHRVLLSTSVRTPREKYVVIQRISEKKPS